MNVFERSGEIVEMSAVSDLVTAGRAVLSKPVDIAFSFSPIYLVNQLYTEHRGDLLLTAESMVQLQYVSRRHENPLPRRHSHQDG